MGRKILGYCVYRSGRRKVLTWRSVCCRHQRSRTLPPSPPTSSSPQSPQLPSSMLQPRRKHVRPSTASPSRRRSISWSCRRIRYSPPRTFPWIWWMRMGRRSRRDQSCVSRLGRHSHSFCNTQRWDACHAAMCPMTIFWPSARTPYCDRRMSQKGGPQEILLMDGWRIFRKGTRFIISWRISFKRFEFWGWFLMWLIENV